MKMENLFPQGWLRDGGWCVLTIESWIYLFIFIELPMEELVKENVEDNFSKLGEAIFNE